MSLRFSNNGEALAKAGDGGILAFSSPMRRERIVSDTFTGDDGTYLRNHQPEIGPPDTWGTAPLTWILTSNAAIDVPVLGGEKVTNGTFAADLTGWTSLTGAGGGTIAQAAGTVLFTQVVSSWMCLYQALTTVTGNIYQVSVNRVSSSTGLTCKIGIGTNQPVDGTEYTGNVFSKTTTANGVVTLHFIATGTTTYIAISDGQEALATSSWDDVSVKPFTTSELTAPVNVGYPSGYIYPKSGGYTIPAGGISGVWGASTHKDPFDPAAKSVICLIDRTSGTGKMIVNNAGTLTTLVNTAITYAADAVPVFLLDETKTYGYLWYNGALVGSRQNLSAYGLTGIWWGLFDVGGGTCTGVDIKPLQFGSDLLTGWDFTSGWGSTAAITINDSNTFTSTAAIEVGAGIYKDSLLAIGKIYRLIPTGNHTAESLKICLVNNIHNAISNIITDDINILGYTIGLTGYLNLYIRSIGSGVINVTTLDFRQVQ